MSFAGTRATAPLDELARCSRTPLRFVCCARARSSPRPPARPGAGPPDAIAARTPSRPAAARPPRQSLPVGQLGGTSTAQPSQRVNGAFTALTWHSFLSRTPSGPRHSSQDRRVLSRRVRRSATMSAPQSSSCFAWLEGRGTRLPRREHRGCRFSLAVRAQPFEKLLWCRVRAQHTQRRVCPWPIASPRPRPRTAIARPRSAPRPAAALRA